MKMAALISLRFVEATIAQDTAVLKRYRPRTAVIAFCASRKVSGPVSDLIYQELPIFSHYFLA